jgi:hypothetical protein
VLQLAYDCGGNVEEGLEEQHSGREVIHRSTATVSHDLQMLGPKIVPGFHRIYLNLFHLEEGESTTHFKRVARFRGTGML